MSSTLDALTAATAIQAGDLFYISRSPHETGDDRKVDDAVMVEFIQDTMNSTLVAGTNIGIVYNDGAGTITISYTGAAPPADTDDLPEGAANFYFHGLSGDVTATAAAGPGAAAATIANDAVTNAKMANMAEATFKMRAAGAGTGDPIDGTPAQLRTAASVQEVVTAARTYYVRTDGSDSNDGLTNTAGGAFLTIQKAADVIGTLNIASGIVVTAQVGDGTYTGAVVLRQPSGAGTALLQGNTTTPSNVIISVTSADAINVNATTKWSISGFEVRTTTSGTGIFAPAGSIVTVIKVNYGACATFHQWAREGGTIFVTDSYTISGGTGSHRRVSGGGRIIVTTGKTFTLTGTPAFSNRFANISLTSYLEDFGNTYSGAATGTRYVVASNAVCNTNSGGANYFPGDVAGTTATGGQYL